ncbi:copper amine oxidase N-terminal domain-containing protein [Neofamilia massiliensis]|uniref:copper amine oxidase N-terminal domain-containing protein n=1 Tax=Neofamilia massiliensis TaxID=1673724 RepID=UPI0006BB634F|nr:copper amine oxidase N-terminal domain-containing protein [Neofamilia massiliensis]
MFKKTIKTLTLALGLVLLFSPMALANSVNIIINGSYANENLSETKNYRTYVPLRFLAEELGFEVSYNDETKEIIISKDDQELVLNLDSDLSKLNNKDLKLEEKPYLKDGRTMVPLRFLGESLGLDIKWNEKAQAILVNSKENEVYKGKKVFLDPLYAQVTLPESWKDEIELSYDFANQGDLAVISKKLKTYLEKNNLDGDGIIFLVENSTSPLLESHGLNLAYDPSIERFIYLTKQTRNSFPKDLEKELNDLQEKYVQAFKSLEIYKDLDKKVKGYDLLKSSDKKIKEIKDLEKIKNLIAPWFYFDNTLTYIREENEGQKIYLPNFIDRTSSKLSSKLEMFYNKDKELEKYFLKFYEDPKKLAYASFTDSYAQREIKFFMKEILGYDESISDLKEDKNILFGDFQNGSYKAYKDNFGNKYIFNMTTGYLEYMSK